MDQILKILIKLKKGFLHSNKKWGQSKSEGNNEVTQERGDENKQEHDTQNEQRENNAKTRTHN